MKQYNYTPLVRRPLNKHLEVVYWYIVGALIFCSVSVIAYVSHLPTIITIVLMFLLYGIGYLPWRWLSGRYVRAIQRFVALNHIVAVDARAVSLPDALLRNGAHDIRIEYVYEFPLDVGEVRVYDYAYTVGAGRNSSEYYGAVAQFHTQSHFPNIYLDGRRNKLGSKYQRSQRVSLEGNFDEYFDLYIPNHEEVNVLSIITPDVMRTLIDAGRPYDIAIDGDTVAICSYGYLYSQNGLPHILAFANKFAIELAQRSASWQDALPGAPEAPRLRVSRRKISGPTLITIICIVLGLLIGSLGH